MEVIGDLNILLRAENKISPAIAYSAASIKKPHEALPTRSPINKPSPMFSTMKKIKNTTNNATPVITAETMEAVLSATFIFTRSTLFSKYSLD